MWCWQFNLWQLLPNVQYMQTDSLISRGWVVLHVSLNLCAVVEMTSDRPLDKRMDLVKCELHDSSINVGHKAGNNAEDKSPFVPQFELCA